MADFDKMTNIMNKQPQVSWAECFGPTLQGEGKHIGEQAYFIRLGLCNLDCKWCDTPYTWDWTGKNGYKYSKAIELQRSSVNELASKVPQVANMLCLQAANQCCNKQHSLNWQACCVCVDTV
jgi:7-carboxy-7-deazaguanine synthase